VILAFTVLLRIPQGNIGDLDINTILFAVGETLVIPIAWLFTWEGLNALMGDHNQDHLFYEEMSKCKFMFVTYESNPL